MAWSKRSEQMKETTQEMCESPTTNTGGLVAAQGWRKPCLGHSNQLKEGRVGCREESDPFIVVRDGKTDHKAKGWAERQSKQRTDPGKRLFPLRVSSSLLALGTRIVSTGYDASPTARLSEEPYAGKSHVGICEGGAG